MSVIYLFRGKAATGKTMITDLLSESINVPIIRKDDIYDKLATYCQEHSVLNSATYDILAEVMRTNIRTNCDMIIDIGLAHNPYMEQFESKIYFYETEIHRFLCTCSNVEEWKRRIQLRIQNPKPNQFFKTVEEAEKHYSKYNISPFKDEVILDSSKDVSLIMQEIYQVVGFSSNLEGK